MLMKLSEKKRKKASKNREGPFMKTKFLVPASNTVERFLSVSGYTFNDYRQKLLLENLEMQLFLKLIERYRDEELVNSCCN